MTGEDQREEELDRRIAQYLEQQQNGTAATATVGRNDLRMLSFPNYRPRPRNTNNRARYISSGLWRDVWSMAPRIPKELVVLKMMKSGKSRTMIWIAR